MIWLPENSAPGRIGGYEYYDDFFFSEITLPITLKVTLLAPKVTSRGMYVTFHHTLSS